jgi:uncharacterized protein (TIGR03643 family)
MLYGKSLKKVIIGQGIKKLETTSKNLHCEYSGLPSVWAYQQADKVNTDETEPILTTLDIERIIEMAWEDRTPFDAINAQFGIAEQEVIKIMRKHMRASSFRMWRERVQGRKTKHLKKRNFMEGRFKCNLQRGISNNKISKR